MHYIYLLRSKQDKALYIGYTNNLRKRIKMHNLGKVFSTKPRNYILRSTSKQKGRVGKREILEVWLG